VTFEDLKHIVNVKAFKLGHLHHVIVGGLIPCLIVMLVSHYQWHMLHNLPFCESIDLEQFAYGMKIKIMILKCT
jgi:hypothetical protein